MLITLGAACLSAFCVGAFSSSIVPKLAEAWTEARHGKQIREAALAAGDLDIVLQAKDWKVLEVEGREFLVNDAELAFFSSLGPRDWQKPDVIRLWGEVMASQAERTRRIEKEL